MGLADNAKQAYDGAIDGEPDEFPAFDEIDHPFAGKTSDNEGRDEADKQRQKPYRVGGRSAVHDMYAIKERLAEYGDDDHEEGELCDGLFAWNLFLWNPYCFFL